MEGQPRPPQRARLESRRFTPSRLQEELLAAVYDRVLAAGASMSRSDVEPRDLEIALTVAEQDQPNTTGG
jgi:hypothetical protein